MTNIDTVSVAEGSCLSWADEQEQEWQNVLSAKEVANNCLYRQEPGYQTWFRVLANEEGKFKYWNSYCARWFVGIPGAGKYEDRRCSS